MVHPGPQRVSTLTLKVEDSSLTGKLSVPGRDGTPVETPVTDGKVDGDNINFNVIREYNGNSNTNIYSGTLTNDEIIGTIQFNRNGETQTRKWDAVRSTAAN
jgi:phage head maturation protease